LSPAAWVHELRGVTIPDVAVAIAEAAAEPIAEPIAKPTAKPTAQRRGSFLFTHFGLSGPVVMDLSRVVTERPSVTSWQATCDFLPAMKESEMTARLAAEASAAGKKAVVNVLDQWAPRRLVEALMKQAHVPVDRRLAELSRTERIAIVQSLKSTAIPITGSLGFKKAEVTAGGVSLDDVDSRTMQSKRTPNLYLAGEILDLDGPIGGYNFQAAFSTGWLAGESV
jgi:predicted Rossmann fold flavoprotein